MKSTPPENSIKTRVQLNFRDLVVPVHVLILSLIAVIGLSSFVFTFRAEACIYVASLLLLILFLWCLVSWKMLTDSLFDPYALFLIAALLFNGGHAILEIFQLNEFGFMFDLFPAEVVLKTLFLVILGTASFHLGGLVSARADKRKYSDQDSFQVSSQLGTHGLRRIGWILVLISFMPTLLLLKEAVMVVLSSGYIALFQRDMPTGPGAVYLVLSTWLIPGTIFLLVGSNKRMGLIILTASMIMVYASIQLFLGSRSAAAMPLIAYAWVWHHFVRPLKKSFVIAFFTIILFFVFPFIGVIRGVAGEERLSFFFLMDVLSSFSHPVRLILSEMGGSMITIAHTIELVPLTRGYDMGFGYLSALFTVFPNLFWEVHPSIARGLPSDWLTWTVAPDYAVMGNGLGFSFIAEAYLNFGWFFSPVALCAIGYLLGRFVLWAQTCRQPAKMATVASFSAFLFIFARGESSQIIRALFWYSLLPYLAVSILSGIKRAKNVALFNPGQV